VATTAILSALEQEQQGLLGQLAQARRVRRAGRDFWRGTLQGTPVVLALSRIGKVAAATTATTLIEAFDATRIVFTGVAGGLGPQVQVGDMVVASHFVQHDMDASPLFPRFEIPLYQRTQFACDPHLTRQLARACRDAIDGLPPVSAIGRAPATPTVHQGLVASGDRFIATAQTSREVRHALRAQSMDALAVEMEGGAVAQVCHDYGIPFAAVRTISDRADDTAHIDFQQFIDTVAAIYTRRIVDRFLRAQAAPPAS